MFSKDVPINRPCKISLVNLIAPYNTKIIQEPLGIESIKGYLCKIFGEEIKTTILICQDELSLNQVFDAISETDILGLSVNFGTLDRLDKIISFVRTQASERKPLIVLGNVVAAFNYRYLLEKYPEALIVRGEGEVAFHQIVKMKKGIGDIAKISNLAYIEQGKVRTTNQKQCDLAKIDLPNRELLPAIINNGGQVLLESSRGCDGFCSFCARRAFFGSKRRKRELKDVIHDMVHLAQNGAININIIDEDILGNNSEEILSFANQIISLKKKKVISSSMTFFGSIRADSLYSPRKTEQNIKIKKAVNRLKEAGLVFVFIGIESGSVSQLRRYAKPTTVEINTKALKILKELNIPSEAGFIMFDPLVTIDEILDNVNFLKTTGLLETLSYPFHQLRIQRETKIKTTLEERSLLDGDYNPDWLTYGYKYLHADVAGIIYTIKKWEPSSFNVLLTIKNISRSCAFSYLPMAEQKIYKAYLSKIKNIYIQLLENVALSFKNKRLRITDVVDEQTNLLICLYCEMIDDIDNGRISSEGKWEKYNLKENIYDGIVREIIIRNHLDAPFGLEDLFKNRSFRDYSFEGKAIKNIVKKLLQAGELYQTETMMFMVSDEFPKIQYLSHNDLPKPAMVEMLNEDIVRIGKIQKNIRKSYLSIYSKFIER